MDNTMVRFGSRVALFAWAILATMTQAIAGALPPEAFGAAPAQTDVVLSPDGHWLAWLDQTRPESKVVMFNLVEKRVQRILATPERTEVRNLLWHDNETLLIVVSEVTPPESADRFSQVYTRIIAQTVQGGSAVMLPTRVGRMDAPFASLVRARTAKEHTVVMANYGLCNAVWAGCLLEVNTQTGEGTVLKVGNDHTATWVVDRRGQPLAREDWDRSKHAYRLYALSGNNIREILRQDDSSAPHLAGVLQDDSAVIVLAAHGLSHRAAWAIPLDGSPPRVLVQDPEEDVTGTYIDPYTGAVVGVYIGGVQDKVRWLDPSAQRRYDALQRAFGKAQVEVYGWTADGTRTLARVHGPSLAPLYYLVDFKTNRADIAAEEYPLLAGVALGELKEITYKSRDGTPIPAYLTTPPGTTVAGLPLVVLPHDGPARRDYPGFDLFVQFLASRGYAVLQPQFRGSVGFGEAFYRAGIKQWGRLMQDDVTDGVRAMIEQGIADPHRVCIVGTSYGGYVALAGAAFTPELYACAASIDGISDLSLLMREEVPMFATASTMMSRWKAEFGTTSGKALREESPLYAVNSIRIPVLIMYTTRGIPIEQSERMTQALIDAGKTVTVVKLQGEGEDHWLSRAHSQVEVFRQLESFLKRSLH